TPPRPATVARPLHLRRVLAFPAVHDRSYSARDRGAAVRLHEFGGSCGSTMTRRGSQLRRTLAALLTGGALAVVLMLALPGLSMAEPAVAGPATGAPPPTRAAPG